MTTTGDSTDDIFDEESDVNFGDKEWNRLKESLTKVHIYHNSRYIRRGSEIDRTCWAWIHGHSYVTPIVYLHSFMEGNQSGWFSM